MKIIASILNAEFLICSFKVTYLLKALLLFFLLRRKIIFVYIWPKYDWKEAIKWINFSLHFRNSNAQILIVINIIKIRILVFDKNGLTKKKEIAKFKPAYIYMELGKKKSSGLFIKHMPIRANRRFEVN